MVPQEPGNSRWGKGKRAVTQQFGNSTEENPNMGLYEVDGRAGCEAPQMEPTVEIR